MSNKLKKERRSNDEFEIMLSNLTLEEVIGLKLELSTKPVSGRLYGIPIWSSIQNIVQDAVFKYAFSATRTQAEAMRFLGLKEQSFHILRKKFGIDDYFVDKKEET